MNHLEAYNILINRVEWQQPLDTDFNFLNFTAPESGRFLQEEHTCVSIPIIYETMYDIDVIENTDFQDQLEELKKKAILQMLHDVFYDRQEVEENWITCNPALFDYAIILKNTSNIIFNVLNSTRKNLTTKVSEENLKRWFIDLNGLKDAENGVYTQGFTERYRREIERIRKALFLRSSVLEVITVG